MNVGTIITRKASMLIWQIIIEKKMRLFVNLDESFRSFVKFGNNERVPMLRKGKIRINLKTGKSNFIFDIFYVPNFYHNLLSRGQLSDKRYDLCFNYNIGIITNDRLRLIVKVYMNTSHL